MAGFPPAPIDRRQRPHDAMRRVGPSDIEEGRVDGVRAMRFEDAFLYCGWTAASAGGKETRAEHGRVRTEREHRCQSAAVADPAAATIGRSPIASRTSGINANVVTRRARDRRPRNPAR